MGVKNLWDILESCKKTLPLHHLQNKRVCIDLSCWMVQLQNVNKTHCGLVKDKPYIRNLFHRLRALIALNCSLIFVADGSIPAIKLATYRRRLNLGLEVAQDETNSQKACSLRRNMGSEFSCMIKEAKDIGLALGIPCLESIEEAEAQCALLNSESLCDGCFSSDSDVFLFGGRTVYRDICLGEGHVVCYEMEEVERKLGFGRNSLITLALILGSDYSPGVHGLGPESALQIVKSIGDSNVLQKIASEGLPFAKKIKTSKKQMRSKKKNSPDSDIHFNAGSDNNSERKNECLQVIDAYLKPKCHPADSDAVCRVLSQHPFQRLKLQGICAQFFGWSPEKTDEYTLPKIAERDLRRFANLRSTSSELGVNLPLQKIPVKCPVPGVVKQRKVQGTECFEVLWEGFDGLKTSIVPADLLESACPEKIAEFEEKTALGKKQNKRKPGSKKSGNRLAMAEIDLRLQTLLLDIESGSNTACSTSLSSKAATSEDMTTSTAANHTKLDPHNAVCRAALSTETGQYEIIDLWSPSPVARTHTVSRCQRVNDQHSEVIDLSESENEMSPEHARKARALRLFIASMRDEMS
ncbi:PREDICTED: flap endonuclease GEN-like 2 isoform X3 [Populus euphratica]|uniref:Flap endonuclease GEN-like 2 isoform X3 n=1 Tax=Populus euphratica TaxID=75702 RepID=A0AAJ6YAP2_POPEU|nr:PREDICTED: flap endonuclease GEN-like 2 isoform X3 [Populus euphratica]